MLELDSQQNKSDIWSGRLRPNRIKPGEPKEHSGLTDYGI